jgi:hypothetical protein
MFFICVTTLAMGGWEISFRRVTEAISTMVPIFGAITFVVLLYVVLGHKHHIYHWLDSEAVAKDPILKGKAGFLNPTFFIIWTTLAIGFWSLLGWRMRKLTVKQMQHQWTRKQAQVLSGRSTVRAACSLYGLH